MHSLEKSKYENFYQIPSGMIDDENFKENYLKVVRLELDRRISLVLSDNYVIVEQSNYYSKDEISYGTELQIRKTDNSELV